MSQKPKTTFRAMLWNYLIETIIYGGVAFLYFKFVLQFFAEPISELFSINLSLYAWLSLILILIQAFILEMFISLIVNGLRLRWPRK